MIEELIQNQFAFMLKPAVEKILKAALLSQGIDPTRTHDLVALALAIQKIPLHLPLAVEILVQLNPYAVQSRYDDSDIEYISSSQAEGILKEMRLWVSTYVQI